MRRVLYLLSGKQQMSASTIYRVTIPATMIERNQEQYGVDYLWLDDFGNFTLDDLRQYSIVIFPRFYISEKREGMRLETAKLFRLLRENGIRILVEFDDDYSNEFRRVIQGDFTEVAGWTDGCIVTTPLLAERIQALTGVRTFVCPNSVIRDLLDPAITGLEKPTRKLSILLSGSHTHNEDWRVLADVLPEFMAKYQDRVELWIGGFHPVYLQGMASTRYLPVLPYMLEGNQRSPFFEYVGLVQTADIVLCPVVPDDRFNWGKSEIKAVEGMGGGALVIATDNPVYRLAIEHEKTGYLVPHTAIGWTGALEFAVNRPKDCERIARRGYFHAWKHYDAGKNWRKWVSVFNNVIRWSPNRCILPIDSGYPIG